MVAGGSLKVAEHAGWGIAADAAIGMSGAMHDTTARTFAARPYSGFAYGNTVTRVFHQACDEIGDEPWAIPQFFFHHVEPLKLLVLQPGGGDPP